MSTADRIEQLVQTLATRKSLVVSVECGRRLVAAVVELVGRCHTTCGGRHVWRVEIEGAGTLVISVSAQAGKAAQEGVYVALVGQPAQIAPLPAPAPTPRAQLRDELRTKTKQIMERKKTRQPTSLEVAQMAARALYGHPRRPEDGTDAYRRLRAS